jgi:hypothetical protein
VRLVQSHDLPALGLLGKNGQTDVKEDACRLRIDDRISQVDGGERARLSNNVISAVADYKLGL